VSRRTFLRSGIVGTAALGLLACAPSAPSSPAAPAKPTEAAKPAAPAAPAAQASPVVAAPAAPAASPVVAAKPGETPRRGGELTFVVSAEPPSFDGHKETTFAMLHPTAPHYSLLVKFDQASNFEKVTGDLAESWTASPDGQILTFKLRDGVKFHNGAEFSSKDVKASYERIVQPPEGILSARKATYAAVESIDAPDPRTVIFKLKQPSASMLALLASPWNYIYSAADLEKDPKFPEKNINGTGPFTFVEYQPGSHWVGKRNETYFQKDKPYLDGFRALFIRETAAQVAAVRGERAQLEFRGFTPQARDDISKALGDKITVQESPWISNLYAAININKKPFDDLRVRRALNLAIDRWEGARALAPISIAAYAGGLMRPGSQFSMTDDQLAKIEGYGRDGNAAKAQARELLKEAGVPDGFSFTFRNRDIPSPYEPVGLFLIDQWRKIGLNVTQQVLETTSYYNDMRAGNFEVGIDFIADYLDEPDVQLPRWISSSPLNYAKYKDEVLDDLFLKQTRETDPEKRKQLVWQFEQRVAEQAYMVNTLWWQRIVPHSSRLKGWKLAPSHYVNQDLADAWLSG
jgi:peptide/nickel transport system substrate-binding protein